jgi:SAM-dependent methyltransferase
MHRYAWAQRLVGGLDVLDCACGEGYGSRILADSARSVTGVDIDSASIEHARRRYAADGLDIARSTLEWHLDHLVEQQLVDKQRDNRNHITLVLREPEDTARLLRLVEPSVADRLVDRFTRLVDGLLPGDPSRDTETR